MRILTAHIIHVATLPHIMHSTCAKDEILTHQGLVVALTLPGFYLLGWLATPIFCFIYWFLYRLSSLSEKMKKLLC